MSSHRVDRARARAAFERAEAGTEEVFGDFFLARLLGLEISYPGEACEVAFTVEEFMFNPRGTLHGGVMATALDLAVEQIQQIQRKARVHGNSTRPRWPMIILNSPKEKTYDSKCYSCSWCAPA